MDEQRQTAKQYSYGERGDLNSLTKMKNDKYASDTERNQTAKQQNHAHTGWYL
jgi:hypothetical protein